MTLSSSAHRLHRDSRTVTNWARFRRRAIISPLPMPFAADLLRRTLPLAMVSLAIVAVPLLVFAPEGLPRLKAMQRELADLRANNEQLRRDVARLRVDVRRLREDPAAVERIARDELGMVRKNEVVLQFSTP